ncbi:MAG: MBG domain-containing protein [Christensenellales bacterium]|jgi:hypothetical protein
MKKSLIVAIILTAMLSVFALSACSSEGIPIVEELTIVGSPDTEYRRGEELDLKGAQLRVKLSNGNEIFVPIDESMLSTYDMNLISTQTVVITYKEKRVSFAINIYDSPVISIAINTEPAKKNYIEGEDLVLDGGYINVNYDIGDPAIKEITPDMISGYDKTEVGEQTVRVTYEGHTASYKVNVRAKALMEMRIEQPVSDDLYTADDEVSLEGGKLRLIYDNGTHEIVNMTALEDMDVTYNLAGAVGGKTTVTLSYQGKSTSFIVNVVENSITSHRLIRNNNTIDSLPGQKVNTDLNLEGVSIELRYSDGDREVIALDGNKVVITGYNSALTGRQNLTLTFYNNLSTDIEITVLEKTPTQLEIIRPSGIIYQDSVIDISDWTYTVYYDNGSMLEGQPLSEEMIEGGQSALANTDLAGELSLTVSLQDEYGFIDTVYTVQVTALTISSYQITPSATRVVYLNHDLNLTDIRLVIEYNSGRVEQATLQPANISGYDKNQLGTHQVTVNYVNKYGSIQTYFTAKVIRKAVSLSVVADPDKMTYIKGDTFDPAGMQINIEYEDANEPVLITDFGSEWQGIDTVFDYIDFDDVQGEYNPIPLQLTYTNSEMDTNSVSVNLYVNVRNDLVSVSLNQEFETVLEGLKIDTQGYYAILHYENGETEQMALNYETNIIGFDYTDFTPGLRTFTVRVSKRGKIATTSATIEVLEKSISGIEIKSISVYKTEYDANSENELDTSGILINILFNNNTFSETNWNDTNLEFSGFEAGVPGEQTITITYLGEYTCSYVITVAEPRITQLSWKDGTTPHLYITQGQEVVFPSELEILVTTQFGDEYYVFLVDILDEITIEDLDIGDASQQQPRIIYRENSLSFMLDVGPRTLVSIEFAPASFIPDVKEGMDLDLNNARIIAHYDNGTQKEVSIRQSYTDYNKNNLSTGPRNIIITYTHEGVSKTLGIVINVLPKLLAGIEIITMPKYYYIEGEPFTLLTADGNESRIRVNYDNNTFEHRLLSEAVIGSSTAAFNVDISAFDNREFTGTNQAQRIVINYTVGTVKRSTEYNISMNDRLYAHVAFSQSNVYSFYYGSATAPEYQLMGYAEYDKTAEPTTVLSGSQIQYVNVATGAIHNELPTDVGQYTVVVTYPGDAIHNELRDESKTIIIYPKAIFVYAEDAEKIYGAENPEISIRYLNPVDGREDTAFAYGQNGSIFGDTLNIQYQSGTGTILPAIGQKTPAGAYSIILSGLQSDNYAISYVYQGYNVGIFTIHRRDIVIEAHHQERVYGIANIVLTYDVYGTEEPESGRVEGDTLYGGLMRPANNDVGEYVITQGDLTNANNPNYNISFISNTVTITKKDIYVVADNLQRVYGDPNPTLTVKYYAEPAPIGGGIRNPNAFAYSDTPASLGNTLVMQTTANINSIIGTYPIYASGLSWSNYEIHYEMGYLTVLQRPIEVEVIFETPEDGSKIYGTPDPASFQYRVNPIAGNPSSGLKEGDTLSGQLGRASQGGGLQNDPVGEYDILLGSLYNSNYIIENFVSARFTITKRDAVIEIPAEKLTRVYNGQAPSITASDYVLINGYNINSANVSVVFPTGSRNVGNYYAAIQNNDTNHNIVFSNPEGYLFTITQKEVRIQFKERIGENTYQDLESDLTFKESAYYFAAIVHPDDVFEPDQIQVEINLYSALEVGTYNIAVLGLDNSNYKLPASAPSMTVTINKRELTLYLKQAPEGSNEIRVPYTGQEARVNKFLAEIKDADGNTLYNNGTYYGMEFDFNIFVVNPSGSTQPPKNVRFNAEDEIIGYDISAVLTETFFARNNVLTLAKVQVGGVMKDYTFIIEQAIADIFLQSTEGIITKTYDTYAPNINYMNAGIAAISINDLDFTFERIEEAGIDYTGWSQADVGEFNVSVAFKPQSENRNYVLRLLQDYKYRITKQSATLRLNNNYLSKAYDGTNAQILANNFNFTNYQGNFQTNLTNGRLSIEVVWQDETRKDAGAYPFTVICSDRNHTITQSLNTTFTINQRPVTFTNITGSKVYGDLDPAITYGVTPVSLVEGETLQGNITRESGENVGSYNFNIQQLVELNPNYSFSYMHTWHFRIDHKEINVFIKNQEGGNEIFETFGEYTFIRNYAKLVVDVSGIVSGESVADVGLLEELSQIYCPISRESNAGLYPITAPEIRFRADSNYKPAPNTSAIFEIKRAPIQMQFNANNRFEIMYGRGEEDLSFEFTGYKFGEGSLQYEPDYEVISGAALRGSNVGSVFTVMLYHENGGPNQNYYFDFPESYECALEIIRTPLSIKIVPQSGSTLTATYGEQPDYDFDFTGFVMDEGPGHPNYVEPAFEWLIGAGSYTGLAGVIASVNVGQGFYSNYTVTYIPTDYVVNKRRLYVGATETVQAFTRSAGTAFTSDWLSLTDNGTALTPVTSKKYVVVSQGDYERKVYTWNGSSYQQTALSPTYDTMHILSGVNFEKHELVQQGENLVLTGNFSFDVNPQLTPAEQAVYGTLPYGLTGGDTLESLFIDVYSDSFSLTWKDNEKSVRSTELFTTRYVYPTIINYTLDNYEFYGIQREVVVHTYLTGFEVVEDELLIDDGEEGALIWLRCYRQDGVQMLLNANDLGFTHSAYLQSGEYRNQVLANITYSEPFIFSGDFTVIGAPAAIPDISLTDQMIRVYSRLEQGYYSYSLKNQNDATYTMGAEIQSGNEYRLTDAMNQPISENYDKIFFSARFSKLVAGNLFRLILNSQGAYTLAIEITQEGLRVVETGQANINISGTDFLTDGFVHDLMFVLNKRDGGLTISIDDTFTYNIDIPAQRFTDYSIAGFDVTNMSAWVKDYRILRQGYKSKLGLSVANANNTLTYVTDAQGVANINLNTLFSFAQVKNVAAGTAYSVLYKINDVALPEVLLPISHITGLPVQAVQHIFTPGYYDITCTIFNNFTDYDVLAEYTARITVVSAQAYFEAKLATATTIPDMRNINKAFGHAYNGDELIATTDTGSTTITLASGITAQYNRLSMVFELDRASYNEMYRTFDPRGGLYGVSNTESFAIISLKTNSNTLNAYTATTNDPSFIGLALAIGYDSASGNPSTRVYLQANGASAFKFVSAIRTDIDWLSGKVRIDATFDEDNDVILLMIYTDYLTSAQALTVIRLDTYTTMYNVSSSSNSLIPRTVINEICTLSPVNTYPQISNVAFELYESRVTLYRLIAGDKKVDSARHEYVEIKDGGYEYVPRDKQISATGASKVISLNDGFNGVYLRSYNTYRVDIQNLTMQANGEVEFIIASNDVSNLLPPGATDRNRTIKLIYSNGQLRFTFNQYGYLSYEQPIDIGGVNLADGARHTIIVHITGEALDFDHPVITGNNPVTANTVNIIVDGRPGVTGYFPYANDSRNWVFQGTVPTMISNQMFLGNYTWAGVKLTNSSIFKLNLLVGEGEI